MKYHKHAARVSPALVSRGFFDSPSRHPVHCDDGMASSLSRVEGESKKYSTLDLTGRLPIAQNDSYASVAVLYARKNSIYKKIAGCDVFDLARDARTFAGDLPVIAHPPCRLWGRLRTFSKAPVEEKFLALHAVYEVRRCGGVLEHPAWSTLWAAADLPLPGVRDLFGGFTLPILQSWWGHKAPKATWLYIVGIEPNDLPLFPFELGIPPGRVSNTGSMKMREGTPDKLAQWLVDLALLISTKQKLQSRIASLFPPSARGRLHCPCAAFDNHSAWLNLAYQIEIFNDRREADYFTRKIEGKIPSVHNEHVKSEQSRESGFRCNTRTLCHGWPKSC